MRRRDLLTSAAGIALACAPKSQGPGAQAQRNVRWRLASSFPQSLDTLYGAATVLADSLRAMTAGRFQIRVYAAGELVPALQVMDAVQQRSVEVGHTASYYYTGKNPALAFDSCVPFGLCARQQDAWLLEAGGLDHIHRLFADFDIITFPGGSTGVQMGGWFRQPLESAAGIRGLKMRIPGIGGEVMSRLGANVQVLAGGDIYPALERGAIDATEWVGPYDDEKLGFYRIAKNYYYPGWWEPGASLSFMVGRAAWDSLAADDQAAFRAAAQMAAATMVRRYDAQNPPALHRLLQHGVQVRPFSEDVLHAAGAASRAFYEEQAGKDAGYRAVYAHWKAFREASFRWFATAELAYAKFAFPA
jgi:TRAP-type mannitol/chloroaromatic compound transport system substrate-binding protein